MKTTDLAKQAKIPYATMRIALLEANRLNRLYHKDFLAYSRVINNTPNKLEIRRAEKEKAHLAQVALRDKTNAVYDELYAMTHYEYEVEHKKTLGTMTIVKPFVKKTLDALMQAHALVKDAKPREPLTQAYLHLKLAYDPDAGEITYNEGSRADKSAIYTHAKPKKPRAQRLDLNRLPLRAKNNPPLHKGWHTYTTDDYALLDDDLRAQCIKRYYLERNPDKTSIHATIRKAYYIRERVLHPRVSLNSTTYSPQAIAYLYMGAGGRFDYTGGLDNIQRIQEEVLCEPYGIRNISPKTNKPCAYPCRDGNPRNYKWENIKPEPVNSATLTRIPTQATKSPIPCTSTESKPRRWTVSTERNIRIEGSTYTVHGMGRGNKVTVCHTWEDAVTVFNIQLKRIKGHKQTLRNGNIMITVPRRETA
jgi:hypothetical protein